MPAFHLELTLVAIVSHCPDFLCGKFDHRPAVGVLKLTYFCIIKQEYLFNNLIFSALVTVVLPLPPRKQPVQEFLLLLIFFKLLFLLSQSRYFSSYSLNSLINLNNYELSGISFLKIPIYLNFLPKTNHGLAWSALSFPLTSSASLRGSGRLASSKMSLIQKYHLYFSA